MEYKTGDKVIYRGKEFTVIGERKELLIANGKEGDTDYWVQCVQPEEVAPVPINKRLSNHDKHILMWDWLAKHPGRQKNDAFDSLPELGNNYPLHGCFACQTDQEDRHGSYFSCYCCPITAWRNRASECDKSPFSTCTAPSGIYTLWKSYKTSEFAEAIRDMEWETVAEEPANGYYFSLRQEIE